MKLVSLAALAAVSLGAQSLETVRVEARELTRGVRLPGELLPYQSVELRARVAGFVERIEVDRGSTVRKGQLIAVLSAPEMAAQIAEAEAKAASAESLRAEAESRRRAAESTLARLREAARTPGAVAAHEVVLAEQAGEGALAAVRAAESSTRAAQASVSAFRELASYLRVTAPFDGVVTERYLHPGALAGPQAEPLVKIEQTQRLRLVVAVPEPAAGNVTPGLRIAFTVPAYKERQFSGIVTRNPRSLDARTRTLPVEADVDNAAGQLAPGMYPEVAWPARSEGAALLVPPTAIATNTERSFVVRIRNGAAEWVDVRRAGPAGDKVQVLGALAAGDEILKRGTDEVRAGTRVSSQPPPAQQPKK